MSNIFQFLSGALMLGFATGGLFFFQFWLKTRDRLFFYFSIAFFIFSIERLVLLFQSKSNLPEDHPQIYLMRLIAFAVILYGIQDKNRNKS
jgi:hypothetical protein